MKCQGYFCTNTGLSGSDYKYWNSKAECDKWFLKKKKPNIEFKEYSYLRETHLSQDQGVIHVPYKLDDLLNVDYIAFKNDLSDRWLYGKISNHEFINEASTKLYFDTDYLASYWDTIKHNEIKGFIQRTHVSDDFQSGNTGISLDKYLLPEPIDAIIYPRYECIKDLHASSLDEFNKEIISERRICILSNTQEEGKIGNIDFNYQAGGSLGGYVYVADLVEASRKINKYISFTSQVINLYKPLLPNITAIYMGPKKLLDNKDPYPLKYKDLSFFVFNTGTLSSATGVSIKHAKTLSYIKYELIGNSGSLIMSSHEYSDAGKSGGGIIEGTCFATGGEDGRFTIRIKPKKINLESIGGICEVSSFKLPSLTVAGTQINKKYELPGWMEHLKEPFTYDFWKPPQTENPFHYSNWFK